MKNVNKILLFLFSMVSTNVLSEVITLTPQQVIEAQKKGVIVVDIRTPEEWQHVGTIPDVAKITFFDQKRKPLITEFLLEFEKLVQNKDQPFILVCASGLRTQAAAKFLNEKRGYTQASHLSKGMKAWIAEKGIVEKSH